MRIVRGWEAGVTTQERGIRREIGPFVPPYTGAVFAN